MTIGIIEGFYGEDWGWSTRHETLEFMAENALSFFIYAPKNDRHLRAEWRTPHAEPSAMAIEAFSEACIARQIHFGLGLTPLKLHDVWNDDGRAALVSRIHSLKRFNLHTLAILFDDMRGDFPHLAQAQADMVHCVAEQNIAERIIMCPTYYCSPGILDRLFGARPTDYLEDLGRLLDASIDVFWTGPKVLSSHYPDEHLDDLTDTLGRKPLIWDNYPVNDGPRMSKHLHLQAPERWPSMLPRVSGVAINPMNQPYLSRVPIVAALTRWRGEGVADTRIETERAIESLCSAALARQLIADWSDFQQIGFEELGDRRDELMGVYAQFDEPAAREVCRWLRGEYRVSAEILTDE
ncbi:MAG: beta-N-acetylglucosaminidase domain-containing protein [Myxococcota bacterium]|nr:beta-N-acetylglucosaminidase domain-containing protein [Myxococcota bacterium]